MNTNEIEKPLWFPDLTGLETKNPNWKRPYYMPNFWPDYGSPAWEKLSTVVTERIEKFGFTRCPKCKTKQCHKVLNCVNCGFEIVQSPPAHKGNQLLSEEG